MTLSTAHRYIFLVRPVTGDRVDIHFWFEISIMAPIPNTLPEDALFLISAAERRYNSLTDSELPKLRQCIGPLSVQQTLAEDLRVDTIALTRQVEVSSLETIF